MKSLNPYFITIAAFLFSLGAQANDTSATIASGGLEFVQQEAVAMLQEDLRITPERIDVRYVFRNESDRDITTLVAFPLPDIGAITDFSNPILPDQDAVNFIDFATRVNGQPVEMALDQRAIALGVDRTAMLREYGLPLEPYKSSTHDALAALRPDQKTQLRMVGLLRDDFDYEEAGWTMHTTYYWEQSFPAGREVVIEHSYRPVAGRSVAAPLGYGDPQGETAQQAKAAYCISDDLATSIEINKPRTKDEYGMPYTSATVEYILKTGANWSGPIRKFNLTVEAASPAHYAFLCLDGVRRISRSTLELSEEDFWPQQDLDILFIEPAKRN